LRSALDQIVGDARAFINLTRSFVTSNAPLPFRKNRVVLEVLEDIHPDAEVIAGVRNLAAQGYSMALDDFVYDDILKPLIELAQFVKIDLMALSREQLNEHVRLLRSYNVKLLAEKIETQEEFEHCKSLGFDYFQGYFLSKPNIVQGTATAAQPAGGAANCCPSCQDPETDTSEIEKLVGQDVALSYKLLRYINSAFFALPKKIDSIRQAVVYLGTQSIKTWVTLLVVAGLGNKTRRIGHPSHAAPRCANCLRKPPNGRTPRPISPSVLFSLLEALMDTPLEKILEALPFSEDIARPCSKRKALTARHSPASSPTKKVTSCVRTLIA